MNQKHEQVARIMFNRFMPQTHASPVWVDDEVKSIAEILRREYEPEQKMLHDATIAIQEREEIRQQRDALLVKLEKAREALECISHRTLSNHSIMKSVAREALKEIGDEPKT